eukprot:SAG11_NODE_512_length_8839_cov_5.600572_8_plen_110_part_00
MYIGNGGKARGGSPSEINIIRHRIILIFKLYFALFSRERTAYERSTQGRHYQSAHSPQSARQVAMRSGVVRPGISSTESSRKYFRPIAVVKAASRLMLRQAGGRRAGMR